MTDWAEHVSYRWEYLYLAYGWELVPLPRACHVPEACCMYQAQRVHHAIPAAYQGKGPNSQASMQWGRVLLCHDLLIQRQRDGAVAQEGYPRIPDCGRAAAKGNRVQVSPVGHLSAQPTAPSLPQW